MASRTRGNATWRALRDDANSKGDPLPGDPDGPLDDLWPHLSVQQQCLVASGKVTFEELVDRITAAENRELCPRCTTAPVSPAYQRLGLCVACARKAMNAALDEVLLEIAAEREGNRIKTATKRARIAAGIPTPRGGTSR